MKQKEYTPTEFFRKFGVLMHEVSKSRCVETKIKIAKDSRTPKDVLIEFVKNGESNEVTLSLLKSKVCDSGIIDIFVRRNRNISDEYSFSHGYRLPVYRKILKHRKTSDNTIIFIAKNSCNFDLKNSAIKVLFNRGIISSVSDFDYLDYFKDDNQITCGSFLDKLLSKF